MPFRLNNNYQPTPIEQVLLGSTKDQSVAVAGFVSRDRKNYFDVGMECTEETYRSILWYRRIVVEGDNLGVESLGDKSSGQCSGWDRTQRCS